MNVVTACRACNHRKSSRTPEQAGMALLYTPYVPSLWEDFILRNRRILADQMEFLMAHLPQELAAARLGRHRTLNSVSSSDAEFRPCGDAAHVSSRIVISSLAVGQVWPITVRR